ncbi:MAG: quinolinate synthase NadA, partial [Propionibacterium sp.]|nr:quinolinate synthase NadA [Propionibacterium sp.]
AVKVIESLGVPEVIMIPDQFLAANIARQTGVKVITHPGACEVHERFTAKEIKQIRADYAGDVTVLVHPECPPEVVDEADYAGSTAQMVSFVAEKRPARVALITECSMSDNVAQQYPDVEFVRPCNLCPHMKRNSLASIRHALETMTNQVTIDPAVAVRARAAVDAMLAV